MGDCGFSQGDLATDKLFTGQRLDDSGLYYYGARYYDSNIGRFISADTIVPDPSNPQSFNRYSYCYNNPLKYVDPDGHVAILAALAVAAPFAIGAAIGGGADLGIQMLQNTLNGDPSFHNINWLSVGTSATFGAISGGISAAVLNMMKVGGSRIAMGAVVTSIGATFNAIDYTFQTISGITDRAWSWTEFGVSASIGAVTGFLSGTPSIALSGIKSGAKYIHGGVTTGVKAIRSTAASVRQTIGNTVVKGVNVIQSTAVSVRKTVGNALVTGVQAVGKTVASAYRTVSNTLESIGSTAANVIEEVWSWAPW